jgi:hypothetical protein
MPFFFTRITNPTFQTRDDGLEYETLEHALAGGIKAALAIAAEEVGDSERTSSVDVTIEGFDEVPVRRSVVSISVAPLHLGRAARPNSL